MPRITRERNEYHLLESHEKERGYIDKSSHVKAVCIHMHEDSLASSLVLYCVVLNWD